LLRICDANTMWVYLLNNLMIQPKLVIHLLIDLLVHFFKRCLII